MAVKNNEIILKAIPSCNVGVYTSLATAAIPFSLSWCGFSMALIKGRGSDNPPIDLVA